MQPVLLVQVSDIHIASGDSDGLAKLRQLSGAIGSLRDNSSHVVILVTGDIAFSGKKTQYELVLHELQDLARSLR